MPRTPRDARSKEAPRPLKSGAKLGKYRILRKLGHGGFADVFAALDTIEGSRVALKIPHAGVVSRAVLEDFYREVRLAARLDHPNILAIKNADFIDGRFVVVSALGEKTLADRLRRRISLKTALALAEQALAAVAFAHEHRVIHCDLKPDNFILFPHGRLRLADFGIARVGLRTVQASGSGTLGYLAPEQAMGKPSQRSDVFSLGLVLWRLFSGKLPEWPFEPPHPGTARIERLLPPEAVDWLAKAIEVEPALRFESAGAMLRSFTRLKPRVARWTGASRRRRPAGRQDRDGASHWQQIRRRQFLRRYRSALEVRHECERCSGPVAEAMTACPWCGIRRPQHRGDTRFPAHCPRCNRGVKLDWRFCAWCYGAGFDDVSPRSYTDRRYSARCSNPRCSRRDLMPFMRYCPWCRRKVSQKWLLPRGRERCHRCGWGVARDFWRHCAWCGARLRT